MQHLQQLCDCMVVSIGAPVPHLLCLALLVSAASVAARPQLDPQQQSRPGQSGAAKDRLGSATSQLGVLVVQLQPHDPTLISRYSVVWRCFCMSAAAGSDLQDTSQCIPRPDRL